MVAYLDNYTAFSGWFCSHNANIYCSE